MAVDSEGRKIPPRNEEFDRKRELATKAAAERLILWLNEQLAERGNPEGLFNELSLHSKLDEPEVRARFESVASNVLRETVHEIGDRFQAQHPDYNLHSCKAYSQARGSSIEVHTTNEDFPPGEFSIIAHLDRIIEGKEAAFLPEGLLRYPSFTTAAILKSSPRLNELLTPELLSLRNPFASPPPSESGPTRRDPKGNPPPLADNSKK
jgi:hypothetical protein